MRWVYLATYQNPASLDTAFGMWFNTYCLHSMSCGCDDPSVFFWPVAWYVLPFKKSQPIFHAHKCCYVLWCQKQSIVLLVYGPLVWWQFGICIFMFEENCIWIFLCFCSWHRWYRILNFILFWCASVLYTTLVPLASLCSHVAHCTLGDNVKVCAFCLMKWFLKSLMTILSCKYWNILISHCPVNILRHTFLYTTVNETVRDKPINFSISFIFQCIYNHLVLKIMTKVQGEGHVDGDAQACI